jgi:hypothetical protein
MSPNHIIGLIFVSAEPVLDESVDLFPKVETLM